MTMNAEYGIPFVYELSNNGHVPMSSAYNWRIDSYSDIYQDAIDNHFQISEIDLHIQQVAKSSLFAGVEPPAIEKINNVLNWKSFNPYPLKIEIGYMF
jgi:hypothetical protein